MEALDPPVRVIVLDDDSLTREMLVATAQSRGFEAVAAGTIEEVNTLLREESGMVSVLSDVDLRTEISGIEAAKEWIRQFPHVRVVFMSGHPPEMIPDFDDRPKGSLFLQKPFSIDDLAQAVKTQEAEKL